MDILQLSDFEKIVSPMRELAQKIAKIATPKNKTKERPGKGGGTWTYAKSEYFEDCLNEHYPGWSCQTIEHGIVGPSGNEEAFAVVSLTIFDHGAVRTITRTGGAEIKYRTETDGEGNKHPTTEPLSIVNDKKASETDGLKRCCYLLGFARDLRVDPADVDITEEQFGLVVKALENAKPEFQEKIANTMRESINSSNYEKFVTNKIMPILKKKDAKNYKMLADIYGDLIE